MKNRTMTILLLSGAIMMALGGFLMELDSYGEFSEPGTTGRLLMVLGGVGGAWASPRWREARRNDERSSSAAGSRARRGAGGSALRLLLLGLLLTPVSAWASPEGGTGPGLAPRVGPAAWCSTAGCEEAGIAASLHRWECHVWPAGPTCSLDALGAQDSGGLGVFGELTEKPTDLGVLPVVPPGTMGRLHLGLSVTAPYSELDEAEWSAGVALKVTLEPDQP